MRLYKYRRVIAVAAIGVAITVGGLNADNDKPQYEKIAYVVEPGDTLWSIAGRYVSNEENIQNFIHDMKKANPHIKSDLQVGDKLIIQKRITDTGISEQNN